MSAERKKQYLKVLMSTSCVMAFKIANTSSKMTSVRATMFLVLGDPSLSRQILLVTSLHSFAESMVSLYRELVDISTCRNVYDALLIYIGSHR